MQPSLCILVKDYSACFLEHSFQGDGGGGSHLETAKKQSLETYGKPQKALPVDLHEPKGWVHISYQCYRHVPTRMTFQMSREGGTFHNKIPGKNVTNSHWF